MLPLALEPNDEPPVETVYQLMVFPAEVAFKLDEDPAVKVEGKAVTEVGAAMEFTTNAPETALV